MESRTSVFKNIIVGAIIGITSMLPGISGATMAVVFRIYERLIRDIADLKTYLKQDFTFLALLVVGALAGMIVCAKVLDNILESYPVDCLMLFVGLIAGQIPIIYRDVNKERGNCEFSKNNLLSISAGLLVMAIMVCITLISGSNNIELGHDATSFILMIFIGVIVAISSILPGLSHSTILLVLGLMEAFLSAISNFDIILLIPLMIGFVGGALGFAKLFQNALEKHHLSTMLFVFGLTVGSIAVIIANISTLDFTYTDIAIGMILFIVGLSASILSDRVGKNLE